MLPFWTAHKSKTDSEGLQLVGVPLADSAGEGGAGQRKGILQNATAPPLNGPGSWGGGQRHTLEKQLRPPGPMEKPTRTAKESFGLGTQWGGFHTEGGGLIKI